MSDFTEGPSCSNGTEGQPQALPKTDTAHKHRSADVSKWLGPFLPLPRPQSLNVMVHQVGSDGKVAVYLDRRNPILPMLAL